MTFRFDCAHIYMYYERMISRILFETIKKSSKSILLLGPRQTGKSTLVKGLNADLCLNLADQEIFLDHTQNYGLLRNLIESSNAKKIFIDEVQRIPEILNTVQALIDENPHLKFYLTGSSARKLKQGGANLLPGRVINYSLGPLIFKEVDYQISKDDVLYGYLPGVYAERNKNIKKDILNSYSANYISEEIKAEALVKNLPAFSRFLELSASQMGQFVDYTKLAQRAKISRHQVPRYFEIFEDTMIGNRIFPDSEIIEKYDLVKHPKFYFFDVGIYNGLQKSYEPSPLHLGLLVEQLVYQQLLHSASALKKNIKINSLRTRGGAEIDFWIHLNSKKIGLEVKATEKLIDDDVRNLVHFKKTEPTADFFLFHFGKNEQKKNGIWCLPIAMGFKEIGL